MLKKLITLLFLLTVVQRIMATDFYINKIPADFSILSFSVLPGDTLRIEKSESCENLFIKTPDQNEIAVVDNKMIWVAPMESGLYVLSFFTTNQSFTIPVFVVVPLDQIGTKSPHFPIGDYENSGFKSLEQNQMPLGMIEVTRENQNTYVSPHFQLKQFLTKQDCDFPKYLILSTKLLYKLELLIDTMKSQGQVVENMFIMSGYRTPVYNKGLGNGKNSRHIFGDAADIYIDNDRNGKMDDLNRDGKIDLSDAKFLSEFVEQIENTEKYQWLQGGLGVYKKTSAHAGFIHIDTRGYRVKW